MDKTKCEIELDGTKPITLKIKPSCPKNTQITEGLRAIVPQISKIHSSVWNIRTGLPTIWVCIQNISVFISTKKKKMFCSVMRANIY